MNAEQVTQGMACVLKTGQAYALRDMEGKAISVAEAKQLVRDRFTVPDEIRRSRRRHSEIPFATT
jgi:hypothetical protein